MPTIAQQIQAAAQAGVVDVGLAQSATNTERLTFAWGPTGDIVWDRTGTYAVLVNVLAKKGAYRADRNYGTLLSSVRRDRRSTGSQLSQYARDGGAQAERAGAAAPGSTLIRVTQIRRGSWSVRIHWSAAGQKRSQEMVY